MGRLPYNLAHVFRRAWLHRASGVLNARKSRMRNVGCILRRSLINHQLERIAGEGMTGARGKNTCEALEISAAIVWQMSRNSELV